MLPYDTRAASINDYLRFIRYAAADAASLRHCCSAMSVAAMLRLRDDDECAAAQKEVR